MNSQPSLRESAPHSTAPQPYVARKFDLSRVIGLSKHALEVHLSLYEGYVKEANSLLPLLHSPDQNTTLVERLQVDGLVRRFAFERNGIVLHDLFFEALRGDSPTPAGGAFVQAAATCYGGFNAWKADAVQLAQTRGVGWVLAVQSRQDGRLTNVWLDDHTRGLPADATPVLALDLWEHAYLLDFKPSQRTQYLQTLFDNIDWQVVNSRCH
jgi:superoxide dismutase, Fe-Mn family